MNILTKKLLMYSEGETPEPDISGLQELLSNAKSLLSSAVSSIDGSDVPTDQYWVPQAYYNSLKSAITNGQSLVNQGTNADYQAVEDAKAQILSAADTFRNNRRQGTYQPRPSRVTHDTGSGSICVEYTDYWDWIFIVILKGNPPKSNVTFRNYMVEAPKPLTISYFKTSGNTTCTLYDASDDALLPGYPLIVDGIFDRMKALRMIVSVYYSFDGEFTPNEGLNYFTADSHGDDIKCEGQYVVTDAYLGMYLNRL